jgi:putative colanic acid biosynthesis glycosyltransferase
MKNKTPLFSIITVTYNCVSTLEESILSVLNQNCKSFEYLIIDGKSTDGTLEIIRKYQDKLDYWISEKDSGIYNAMNKAIRVAKGKYLNFLNSGDCFSTPESLSLVHKFLNEHPDKQIVYGNIYLRRNNELVEKFAAEPCNKHRMYFCHQSSFIAAEIQKKYGFNEKYKMSADLYFFKLCYYHGLNFGKINNPLVIYDMGGISNTQRVSGLLENAAIVWELDKWPIKAKFLLKLYFVIIWIKIRKNIKRLKSRQH